MKKLGSPKEPKANAKAEQKKPKAKAKVKAKARRTRTKAVKKVAKARRIKPPVLYFYYGMYGYITSFCRY